MKKALILFLTLTIVLASFATVSFAAPSTIIGLDAKSLYEVIATNEEFEVILYTSSNYSDFYSYQIGIDYDTEYFELDSIAYRDYDGYEGAEKIDNTTGKADFAYYIGNEKLDESSDGEKYILAVLTFNTLKKVDKDLAIEIDEERTTLLQQDATELTDYTASDFNIVIPEAPYKTSPTSTYFTPSSKTLRLRSNTADADIYYTTSEDETPTTKYNGSISLPNKSVTYYAIAKKYGISSEKSAIKLSFRNTQGGGGTGGGGGGGYYPSGTTTTTPTTTPSTSNNTATEKYADIKGHWAESYINNLIDKKIINGYEDGSVKPGNTVTRAEIAKIIVCALGQAEASNVTLDFADNGEIADWAKGYIQTAVNLGIINGYEDNTFKATQPVTRQELAKIAMVAFKIGESSKALSFADASSIPSWAAGYISAAVENGIITGYEDNTFNAAGKVTRAEACAIISRCLE